MDSSLGVKSAWAHLWTLSVMNPKRNTAGDNTAGRYFKSQQSFDHTTFGVSSHGHGSQVERSALSLPFASEGEPPPPQLPHPATPPIPQSSEKSGKPIPTRSK